MFDSIDTPVDCMSCEMFSMSDVVVNYFSNTSKNIIITIPGLWSYTTSGCSLCGTHQRSLDDVLSAFVLETSWKFELNFTPNPRSLVH